MACEMCKFWLALARKQKMQARGMSYTSHSYLSNWISERTSHTAGRVIWPIQSTFGQMNELRIRLQRTACRPTAKRIHVKILFLFQFNFSLVSRVSSHPKWHWPHRSRIRYNNRKPTKFRTLCCSCGEHVKFSSCVFSSAITRLRLENLFFRSPLHFFFLLSEQSKILCAGKHYCGGFLIIGF